MAIKIWDIKCGYSEKMGLTTPKKNEQSNGSKITTNLDGSSIVGKIDIKK